MMGLASTALSIISIERTTEGIEGMATPLLCEQASRYRIRSEALSRSKQVRP